MTQDSPDAGRGGLRDYLPAHKAPPALRDRVHATLARRGSRTRRWTGALAAAVLLFVAGMATGRATLSATRQASAATYALLLYGGHEVPNEVEGSRASEYGRWAANLTAATLVSGAELGSVVGAYGPSAGSSDTARVEGFFLIDARTEADAIAVARECPHLKYGGRVVLQRISGGS